MLVNWWIMDSPHEKPSCILLINCDNFMFDKNTFNRSNSVAFTWAWRDRMRSWLDYLFDRPFSWTCFANIIISTLQQPSGHSWCVWMPPYCNFCGSKPRVSVSPVLWCNEPKSCPIFRLACASPASILRCVFPFFLLINLKKLRLDSLHILWYYHYN